MEKTELLNIPISDIEVSDRDRKDYGDIAMLMESIKQEGLISPIAVQRIDGGKKPYKLLAGGRRIEACTKLNWTIMPVRVYDGDLDLLDQKSIELAENLWRKDLTFAEDVALKDRIHRLQIAKHGEFDNRDNTGWGKKHTASMLGETSTNLARDLKLAKALKLMPALKGAKNKNEAMKIIDRLEKEVNTSKKSKELSEQRAETPISKLRKMLSDCYQIGDARELIKNVATDSVDIVEIDPPYGIDIGVKKKTTMSVNLQMRGYTEEDAQSYADLIKPIINESYRVLKATGWMIMWFGIDPWFDSIWKWIVEAGFSMKAIPAIWNKTHGQTNVPSMYLGNAYEPFFYARKTNSKINLPGTSNVFTFKTVNPHSKMHPTERPIEMMQHILSVFGEIGSNVLVPFAGSGNTMLAASNLGMTAVGYDLAKIYKDGYNVKVYEAQPGSYKSYIRGEKIE